MKALLIGGTGVISTEITKLLLATGWEVTLLNRGVHADAFAQAKHIVCDMADEGAVKQALEGKKYDVVAQFICFSPEQAARDVRLFLGKTSQYIFISSASAYQKPPRFPVIDESTPLHNPYWQYSRDKAACEDVLMRAYREQGFPVTLVRPSHTYSENSLPVPIHGKFGAWQVLDRMRRGKKVLVMNGGATLWVTTPSSEFAKGFVGLMGNVHAIGEAVHITSDEPMTWNAIMEVIAGALEVEYKPCYVPSAMLSQVKRYDYEGALMGDKGNSVIFNNDKLKRLVPEYKCTRRFDQAAPISVQNLMTKQELCKPDPEFDTFCDRVVEIMEDAEKKIRAL